MTKHKEAQNTEKTAAATQTTDMNDYQDLKKQFEELTDTLKRIQAEFENYKKRIEKENIDLIKNSNALLIKELLSVLDSFELAIKNNHDDNPEIAKYKKGMELIYAQLFSILEAQGLRPIDTKDKVFDPFKHEVLMVKDGEKDDEILQEFQKGYMLNDNVLRHSKVMITRKVDTDSTK